jgi:hypothetical protein
LAGVNLICLCGADENAEHTPGLPAQGRSSVSTGCSLHQLRTGIYEEIDEGEMTLGG